VATAHWHITICSNTFWPVHCIEKWRFLHFYISAARMRIIIIYYLRGLSHWARLVRRDWSGFTLRLILSNPGAFAFILRNHRHARRMIKNRTRVNKFCFFLLIWCYYVQQSKRHLFTVCAPHVDGFPLLANRLFWGDSWLPFICRSDCTRKARVQCRLTPARIQGKSSTLSSLTCVLLK